MCFADEINDATSSDGLIDLALINFEQLDYSKQPRSVAMPLALREAKDKNLSAFKVIFKCGNKSAEVRVVSITETIPEKHVQITQLYSGYAVMRNLTAV